MSDENVRDCAVCHRSLVKENFSKRQWSRGYPVSKCATCCALVTSRTTEQPAIKPQKTTRKTSPNDTLRGSVSQSKDTNTSDTEVGVFSEEDDTDVDCVNATDHADPLENGDNDNDTSLDGQSVSGAEHHMETKHNHFQTPANVWKQIDGRVSDSATEITVQQLQRDLHQKTRDIQRLQRLVNKTRRNMFLWASTQANVGDEADCGERAALEPTENSVDITLDASQPQMSPLIPLGSSTTQEYHTTTPTSTQTPTCAFCCTGLPPPRSGIPPIKLVWPPVTAGGTHTRPCTPKSSKRRKVAAVPASTVVCAPRGAPTRSTVLAEGIVQCAACAQVGFALYCNEAHLIADRPRHSGECTAMRQHSVKRYLRQGRAAMVQALAHKHAAYKFGLSPNDTQRVDAARTLTPPHKHRCHGNEPTTSASFRSPIEDYHQRTRAGCEVALEGQEIGTAAVLQRLHQLPRIVTPGSANARAGGAGSVHAPCRPWVSYCSPTSVMLNWLPPVVCGRFGVREYVVQLAAQERSSETPTWQPWTTLTGEASAELEAHSGLNTSHIVRGLTSGTKYRFRIGTTKDEPQYAATGSHGNGMNGTLDVVGGCAKTAHNHDAERTALATATTAEINAQITWSPPSDITTVGVADASIVEESGETAHGAMGFTGKEMQFFLTLDTPGKVQDYLDSLPLNHEAEDDTCLSALEAVRQNHAHCIEAAMLGAYVLSLHGHAPLLLDLRASSSDDDHIVTPYMLDGRWGCLSKSNHAALRYRNPVYRTLRELVMSYFDDYLSKDGVRSLRSYSLPIHLDAVFGLGWPFVRGDVGHIAGFMDAVPHFRLCEREHLGNLRPGDAFMTTGQVTQREWHQPHNYSAVALQRNLNK